MTFRALPPQNPNLYHTRERIHPNTRFVADHESEDIFFKQISDAEFLQELWHEHFSKNPSADPNKTHIALYLTSDDKKIVSVGYEFTENPRWGDGSPPKPLRSSTATHSKTTSAKSWPQA